MKQKGELRDKESAALFERDELIAAIRAAPAPRMRPSVAALLDEPEDGPTSKKVRLVEVNRLLSDITAALEIVEQRLRDERSRASTAVCAVARPEYGRRVKALADKLSEVEAARRHLQELIDDFQALDVAWTMLTPLQPTFLGDRHDGHITYWMRSAREAGYVS